MSLVFALMDLCLALIQPGYIVPVQGYAILSLSYGLSRTRKYRAGALVATLMFPLVSVSQQLLVPEPEPTYLFYSILAPFFAGMFLGLPASIGFSIFNPVWIALLPVISGGTVPFFAVVHPLAANLIGGMIAVGYAYRRNWMERRRVESERLHEAQMMQMQKMEALGRLAGGIAHDFNNLLTVISGGVELLGRKAVSKELKLIEDAASSAKELTAQLLTLTRQGVVEQASANLERALSELHQLLARILGEDIAIEVRVGAGVRWVAISESGLRQILLNLATNARDAMPRGGTLSFDAELVPSDGVLLRVRDTGIGMDEAVAQKIFEPFFTTKAVGKGTGLGLAMVFGIVTGAGGEVSVHSRPGEGTEFLIRLRNASASDDESQESLGKLALQGMAQGCILLVEDDSAVRELCRSVLRREGYEVLEAANPSEAIELFDANASRIDLMISDIVMPSMPGPELVETLKRRGRDLNVLYMSGYAPEDVTERPFYARNLLRKPFRPTDLIRRVSAMVYGLESQSPPPPSRTSAPPANSHERIARSAPAQEGQGAFSLPFDESPADKRGNEGQS